FQGADPDAFEHWRDTWRVRAEDAGRQWRDVPLEVSFRSTAPVLRLVMGKLAEELLLSSQRMEPAVLSEAGFEWQHPSLAEAAAWVAERGPKA
ncbi:MAG: DUF1731 domain-containing protein, partial [Arthrobacter sp.]|nr:DUF1731 domain-containing protein [Arthrobacter sp.]